MKFFKWLIKSIIIALIMIFIINILGVYLNINIPLNFWNVLVITFLKLPGAIILIVFFLI